MCKHMKCKAKHEKNCTKIITIQKWWNSCSKMSTKNGWKALEHLETDTESQKPKSWTENYGETRVDTWCQFAWF